MTINELYIQIDLQPENKINILEDVAAYCGKEYLFVDSSDGHCYLFDENGNEDDVKKIKNIGNGAFWGCKSLKSIIIPNSVKNIGDDVFAHCENLKEIEMPHSVESIGYRAFACCSNLKSIEIPDFVKWIGYFTFYKCINLKSIVIPDFVKWIGDQTFYGCESLKSLVFKGKTIDQVKAMENYPFGIKDELIIKCI